MNKSIKLFLISSVCLVFGAVFLTFASGHGMFGLFSQNEKAIDFSKEIYLGDERVKNVKNYTLRKDKAAAVSLTIAFDNNTLRWGVARKTNNQTPDADPGTPELLAKYGSRYLGDTSRKILYLTFDEGYENGYTSKILDTLKQNKVKSIFFVTGPYLKDHEDLVTRMVEEGHEVGNHTIHHPSLPSKNDTELKDEISQLNDTFKARYGKNMRFLRPPMGEYSERSLFITDNMGYCNLFWSFAYDDWHRDVIRGPEYASDMVDKNLHNGAVLLLHAVSKDNADALDAIIKNCRAKGYEFGNPDELLKGRK